MCHKDQAVAEILWAATRRDDLPGPLGTISAMAGGQARLFATLAHLTATNTANPCFRYRSSLPTLPVQTPST